MADRFHYGQLMHKAMRGLMAEVLTQVAESGLPGEHHFFITFDATHPGVDLSDDLAARYPDEMTIVLQDWFEDLTVMPDRFAVTLNFGDVPQMLVIPFDAIRTFVDPSVEFGLKFDSSEAPDAEQLREVPEIEIDDADPEDPAPPPDGGAGGSGGIGGGGGDVVSLDRFRKS